MIFVRDKSFYKKIFMFAWPIAAQQMITVGINMADNIMLGQLGEVSMSAATLANNFINIYQIMCMGMGMGASVLVSRLFGMNDTTNMKKVVNILLRLELFIALLFMLVTAVAPRKIMSIYSPDQAVISAGTGYLLISVPCYFLNGYAVTTSLILRSVGRATIPLMSSAFSFFINIFFNWMFIFGNCGAPRLGVNGAALGTLIARIVEFSFIMGYLFFKDENIHIRFDDLFMDVKDMLGTYFKIAIPVLVSDTLLGVGNSAVAVVVGHIGSTYVAANAITTVVQQLSTVIIQGVGQASCSITGITLGEGHVEKAQQQGVTFAAIGYVMGVISCLIILSIRGLVIGAYNVESETRELAFELMGALAVVTLFQCANNILTKGVLRGGGDTKYLMCADIIFLWSCSIPLGYIAGLVLHLPGFWIFICLKIDQFIKAILCLTRLKSRKWIKKIGRGSADS